ncbi:MAG: hypothetical protein COA94_03710 [Rickettsiales bacterium]|nr:MAG: hypothetical protein COA94_03710 [Rickettsiales bacterium]
MSVITKILKSRMPSIVQSLALVFARLIHTNPTEIFSFLSSTSIENRISLKIVLDKWLLHQPLFRGSYAKAVTLSALLNMFLSRDHRIENLMVIGYNPSHTNINSG